MAVLGRVLAGEESAAGVASELHWLRPAGRNRAHAGLGGGFATARSGGRCGGAVAVLRDVSAEHERALANGMLHRLVDGLARRDHPGRCGVVA